MFCLSGPGDDSGVGTRTRRTLTRAVSDGSDNEEPRFLLARSQIELPRHVRRASVSQTDGSAAPEIRSEDETDLPRR